MAWFFPFRDKCQDQGRPAHALDERADARLLQRGRVFRHDPDAAEAGLVHRLEQFRNHAVCVCVLKRGFDTDLTLLSCTQKALFLAQFFTLLGGRCYTLTPFT